MTRKRSRRLVVYHIALSHTLKMWEEFEPEIKEVLNKVKIIFWEWSNIKWRNEFEIGFNWVSQGKIISDEVFSPELEKHSDIRSREQFKIGRRFLKLIYNSKKIIFFEKMSKKIKKHVEKHQRLAHQAMRPLFQGNYKKALDLYEESMKLFVELEESRDRSIEEQLSQTSKEINGNIMLVLGSAHSIKLDKAKVVRIPSEGTEIFRRNKRMREIIFEEDQDKKEEFLLRWICGEFLFEYLSETKGSLGDYVEKSLEIMDRVPKERIKDLLKFISKSNGRNATYRTFVWLNENNFIYEEELKIKKGFLPFFLFEL